MLFIKSPSKQDIDEYWNSFNGKIIEAVSTTNLNPKINALLTEAKLKEILSAEPKDLVGLHDEVMECAVDGYKIEDYESYLAFIQIQEADRTKEQGELIDQYKVVNRLSAIFDYDRFISKSKNRSYFLATKIDLNTCIYCNRSYTTTVVVVDENTGRVNNSGRIIRPNFDHWFPKSKYPALALCYYNLIPCCPICNSYLKGDKEFSLDTHSHPYLRESFDDYTFSFRLENSNELAIKINSIKGSKIEKTLQEFRIEEIYNSHANFELKDLFDLQKKYSRNYLKVLFEETFKELSISESEIYRMIFGVEYNSESFHKRPFSKFKSDIIKELKDLDKSS